MRNIRFGKFDFNVMLVAHLNELINDIKDKKQKQDFIKELLELENQYNEKEG